MGNSPGRHRAPRPSRRAASGKVSAPVIGVSAVATAGVAVLALTPALVAPSPTDRSVTADLELAGNVYYLRGTNIGDEPTDPQYQTFVQTVLDGTGTAGTATPGGKVSYPASIWPFSKGGLNDPKWNDSVADGVTGLETANPGQGDVVFGFSQGAVAVSKYMGEHPNSTATYVLVENPNRPNGGVLERFNGLTIPIMDVSFNGSTPDTAGTTIDIARQYDGWADFPTYPLNLLATANAIAGIYYVHGKTQTELTQADLDTAEASGDPMYYQVHGNDKYYLIKTERLPILMPFNGIVPDPILTAADAPLRVLVESGYDRTDYSKPTPAQLVPTVNPINLTRDLADATAQGISDGLAEAGVPSLGTSSSSSSSSSRTTLRDRLSTHDVDDAPSTQGPQRNSVLPKLRTVRSTGDNTNPGSAVRKVLNSLKPTGAKQHTNEGTD